MADNATLPAAGRRVATDEVTHSGETADVQLVRVVTVAGAEGSKTVGDPTHLTNTQLRAAPVATVPTSPFFWRVGFSEVGAGLQGLAASELTLLKTGAGMVVSQSAGNLVITTGTTINSETVLRSVDSFRGALLARYKCILSQRIANQVFRFELSDLIGEALAYTINSATSVTVAFPTGTNPFTAANVGQSLRLAVLSSVGIPGRYAIASVSGDNVTFTVAAWPASGSGTLTLYGFNWLASEYSGTTATNTLFDAQRRGWASGNTTATISTTASPGHVGQIAFDVMGAGYADSLVASNAAFQWTPRASRIENIPDEDVQLYFFIVVQNGSTAPASTTTLTVGFLSTEDQPRNKVRISGSDPATSHATPVQVMGGALGTQPVSMATNTPVLAAGTALAADVGLQVRANATGAASTSHIVSAASTNAANVKASAGRLLGWSFVNTTASYQYVKLHNNAAVPTAGAAVVQTIAIPPNGVNNCPPTLPGIAFTTGIARSIVTGSADADATATTAGAVVGDLFFA
jgi:hypothetical protein